MRHTPDEVGPPVWPHTMITSDAKEGEFNHTFTNHHQFKMRWLPVQPYLVEAKKLLYFGKSHKQRNPPKAVRTSGRQEDTWVALARDPRNRELPKNRPDVLEVSPFRRPGDVESQVRQDLSPTLDSQRSLPYVRWNTSGSPDHLNHTKLTRLSLQTPTSSRLETPLTSTTSPSRRSVMSGSSTRSFHQKKEDLPLPLVQAREEKMLKYRILDERPFMNFKTTKLLKSSSNIMQHSRKITGIFKSAYEREGHSDFVPHKLHGAGGDANHEYVARPAKPKYHESRFYHTWAATGQTHPNTRRSSPNKMMVGRSVPILSDRRRDHRD